MSDIKKGRGRPRRAKPSATICFKIDEDKKTALMEHFGGLLNRMFDEWSSKLLEK